MKVTVNGVVEKNVTATSMTRGLQPSGYRVDIDPLKGPWESFEQLNSYMVDDKRIRLGGSLAFVDGMETVLVDEDGNVSKYIREKGDWRLENIFGGGSNSGDISGVVKSITENTDELYGNVFDITDDGNGNVTISGDKIAKMFDNFAMSLVPTVSSILDSSTGNPTGIVVVGGSKNEETGQYVPDFNKRTFLHFEYSGDDLVFGNEDCSKTYTLKPGGVPKMQIVDALPSTPTEGVLYFVKEA